MSPAVVSIAPDCPCITNSCFYSLTKIVLDVGYYTDVCCIDCEYISLCFQNLVIFIINSCYHSFEMTIFESLFWN